MRNCSRGVWPPLSLALFYNGGGNSNEVPSAETFLYYLQDLDEQFLLLLALRPGRILVNKRISCPYYGRDFRRAVNRHLFIGFRRYSASLNCHW